MTTITHTFSLEAHLARQMRFSEATFGPGARIEGVTDHIAKELQEVRDSGGDLKEWVDVIILGFDGAWRSGATPREIIDAIVAKQTRNESRTWPDWRTADPTKAIEHDRAAEPQQEPVDMVLYCPKCGKQHIDAPEWVDDPHDIEQGQIKLWTNPPHKSHLCHGCGHIWRPSDTPTNGVERTTSGKDADTAPQPKAEPLTDAEVDALIEQHLSSYWQYGAVEQDRLRALVRAMLAAAPEAQPELRRSEKWPVSNDPLTQLQLAAVIAARDAAPKTEPQQEPVGTVEVMGSYKGIPSLGCLIGADRVKVGDRLYTSPQPPTPAAHDILAERHRQVTAEGWTTAHDDDYRRRELAVAAACYAMCAGGHPEAGAHNWPWAARWWKPTTPRRDLVKAGALILAEIERLDRAQANTGDHT